MPANENQKIQKLCEEALRANARKRFAAKCSACGKSHTQTLGWLRKHKFKCLGCGGDLDKQPLHQITRSIIQKLSAAPSSVRSKPRLAILPATTRQAAKTSNYQLVIQFRGDALSDLDEAAALEEDLGYSRIVVAGKNGCFYENERWLWNGSG